MGFSADVLFIHTHFICRHEISFIIYSFFYSFSFAAKRDMHRIAYHSSYLSPGCSGVPQSKFYRRK